MTQTISERFWLAIWLRRHPMAARTPAALQVERTNVTPLKLVRAPLKTPAPLRIVTELRGDGCGAYIKVLGAEPRTA